MLRLLVGFLFVLSQSVFAQEDNGFDKIKPEVLSLMRNKYYHFSDTSKAVELSCRFLINENEKTVQLTAVKAKIKGQVYEPGNQQLWMVQARGGYTAIAFTGTLQIATSDGVQPFASNLGISFRNGDSTYQYLNWRVEDDKFHNPYFLTSGRMTASIRPKEITASPTAVVVKAKNESAVGNELRAVEKANKTVPPRIVSYAKNKWCYLFNQDLSGANRGTKFKIASDPKVGLVLADFTAFTRRGVYNGTERLQLDSVVGEKLYFSGNIQGKTARNEAVSVRIVVRMEFGDRDYLTNPFVAIDLRSQQVEDYMTGRVSFGTEAEASNYIAAHMDSKTSTANGSPTTNSPVAFSTDEISVLNYLDGKTFRASSGTEIQIGNCRDLNTYCIKINGSSRVINLTYTPLSKYRASVEGIMNDESGKNVKLYVDSRNHTLENGGTIYFLKR